MNDQDRPFDRRDFLKRAVVGGAAAAAGTLPRPTSAQQPVSAQQPATPPRPAVPTADNTYAFLNPVEAAFVEALVNHMVPADEFSPKGTDIGVNIYIDRALAGAWGKGDRLYMQGPWRQGTPSQGYQLPLTPAQLYRAGIAATNEHCQKAYGRHFDKLDETQREAVLVALSSGKLELQDGLPSGAFWSTVYQTVIEGLFADPIYGGNRDKAGWKMIGFPGVIAVHYQNVEKFRGKEYKVPPLGIADAS